MKNVEILINLVNIGIFNINPYGKIKVLAVEVQNMDNVIWGNIILSIILGAAAIYLRNNIMYLSLLIAAIILIKVFLFLSFNKAINFLHDNFAQIAKGQLNVNIKKSTVNSVNQVGEKINEYLEKIRKLVGEYINTSEITDKEAGYMKSQAESLRITASEIATTTQNIAEAVNSQAESTGEVSNNMEIFSQDVEKILENANLSLKVAKDSKTIVDESFETFREAFEKVEEIKDYNDKVLSDMVHLDKTIRQISVITEAVEEIASQTHLLSLNASIEAARAGEAGRGFAVVAGEVSKLADDSSSSAKKIKDLVNSIIGEIDGLTVNIKNQTDVIGNNIVYAKKALSKSDAINDAVEGNRKAAEAIVQMTARQKENLIEIAQATQVINETTQQNAAVSQEITASTQEQLSIIETMYNSVVTLNNAIQYSNSIIENFTAGFKITDDIQEKVEKTKALVSEIVKASEIINPKTSELKNYLYNKQKAFDFIELIALVDREGWIIGTSIELPETEAKRQFSARQYFKEAMAGKLYVSKEYISIITNNYNITISSPIYRNGIIDGIIFADIDLSN